MAEINIQNDPLKVRSSQLDLLRTLAIALVFASHFNIFATEEWFKPVGQFGWVGVDLFFVLSGFLITHQLLKTIIATHSISFKDFYIRRGLRIWPNYFFVLIVYLIIPAFSERSILPPLWKFLTFTQNFGLDFKASGTFSHAWSLCVEEQFYIFLPFLIIFFYRRGSFRQGAALLLSVIASGILLRYFLWNHFVAPFYSDGPHKGMSVPFYREIYYPTYCRLDSLAVGVAIASLSRLRPQLWKKLLQHSNLLFLISLIFLTMAGFIVIDEYSLLSSCVGYPLIAIGFGCLTIAALSPVGLFSRIHIPGARIGATLAFGFYLTHKQMIHLSKDWMIHWGIAETSFLFPLGILLICLLTATAIYLLIEKPFLLLRDRLLHEKSLHFKA